MLWDTLYSRRISRWMFPSFLPQGDRQEEDTGLLARSKTGVREGDQMLPPPRMTSKSGRGCVCVRCVLHVGVIAETEGGRASERGRANKKRNGMGRSFEIGGGGGSGPSEGARQKRRR